MSGSTLVMRQRQRDLVDYLADRAQASGLSPAVVLAGHIARWEIVSPGEGRVEVAALWGLSDVELDLVEASLAECGDAE